MQNLKLEKPIESYYILILYVTTNYYSTKLRRKRSDMWSNQVQYACKLILIQKACKLLASLRPPPRNEMHIHKYIIIPTSIWSPTLLLTVHIATLQGYNKIKPFYIPIIKIKNNKIKFSKFRVSYTKRSCRSFGQVSSFSGFFDGWQTTDEDEVW